MKNAHAGAHSLPYRRMTGLSLVELMVALTIGLAMLAGVVTIFTTTSSARSEVERTNRQIENGRYAIDLLSDELRLAGFVGEMNAAWLTAPAVLPDPCSAAVADWTAGLPVHVQGYEQGATPPSCVGASLKADSDIIVVRRARACSAGIAGCPAATAGAPYLQVSQCSTELNGTPPSRYVLGLQGTAAYTLRRKDCAALAPQRQYFVNTYFISTDNGAGQSIPTLKRRELTGAGTAEVPLVEGIEYMHFVYGIDHTGDGVPDGYTPDPATYNPAGCGSCSTVNNWLNVMTVQIYIVARNIDPSPGYSDTKTYVLGTDAAGAAVSVGPFNDGYRRHVYTNVVRISNPSGRRDTP